jgi:hypothetical protein
MGDTMIKVEGKKLTANQLAKKLVFDYGCNATYWYDSSCVDASELTSKEIEDINNAVNRQIDRVAKLLGQ